jgi:hypothetical protein
MLGAEPADLPADLVTEYTSGPFSEILTGDGETGANASTASATGAAATATGSAAAGFRAAGLAAAGLAGARVSGAVAGWAAAARSGAVSIGRGRRRRSVALGLAVLLAAGVTSELALLQHRAAHQAQRPVSPSLAAIPTLPASVVPTAAAAPIHKASAAPTVAPTPPPAAVPVQEVAPSEYGQQAGRYGHHHGWLPAGNPGPSGWHFQPIGPGSGQHFPGIGLRLPGLPGGGGGVPHFGFSRHW